MELAKTMRLKPSSPVCLAVLTAFASQLAFADNPSAPGDLQADVYSSTAGEIFWSRSTDTDGIVVSYDILQDGNLIASRDALSFFTDSLIDGVTTTFSVIAVDNDGERSDTVSISLAGGTPGNNTDGQPLPPANLFATVYSATAAEIFFDRNTEQTLTYEVSVDGEVVANTDGISFFFDDLDGGRVTVVDVVAINANGQRSGAASVQFTTTGDGSGNPPETSSIINPPANLRLDVYSATAGELFWDRSSQTDLIEFAEVRRDGLVLGSTDGTSFFDDSREAGVAYRYEVRFMNLDGGRSDAAVVDETDGVVIPDNDPDLLSLNQDNEILQTAVSIASLASLNELNSFVRAIIASDRSVEACDEGGSKLFTTRNPDAERPTVDLVLDNCAINGQVIDGDISFNPLAQPDNGTDIQINYFTVSYSYQAGNTIILTGGYLDALSVNLSSFPQPFEDSTEQSWVLRTLEFVGDEVIEVFDFSAEFTSIPSPLDPQLRDIVRHRASFGFAGNATGGVRFEYRPVNELERASDSPFYDSGIFRIEDQAGSSLDVNFGTGDPATVLLILQTATGSEDSSQDVASGLDRLLLSVPNVDPLSL